MSATEPLFAVEGLTLEFRTRTGTVRALEDVSFEVGKGEILGVVGESGSGKSVTAYAIMGLLDPTARVLAGRIRFAGLDLLDRPREPGGSLASVRGRDISMIFQSPRTALNPIRTVGAQVADVLVRHGKATRSRARAKAIEALARVHIPDPERRYHAHPFELSGGLCQRVMIAMALACEPLLLIADEPTTGLDVTTQAVVMDLVREFVDGARMAALLITHDLGLAGEYCDRVTVMHAGHTVESAPADLLLRRAAHPYSARLVEASPGGAASVADLASIPGDLPDLRRGDLPPCRFRDRCDRREARCDVLPLPRAALADDHVVRCWRPAA